LHLHGCTLTTTNTRSNKRGNKQPSYPNNNNNNNNSPIPNTNLGDQFDLDTSIIVDPVQPTQQQVGNNNNSNNNISSGKSLIPDPSSNLANLPNTIQSNNNNTTIMADNIAIKILLDQIKPFSGLNANAATWVKNWEDIMRLGSIPEKQQLIYLARKL
jgi:hypothetical protein